MRGLISARQCIRHISLTYLGDRRGEYNNFIQLAHSLHKLVDSRSLNDIYVVIVAFNFDRYRKVGLVENLGKKY